MFGQEIIALTIVGLTAVVFLAGWGRRRWGRTQFEKRTGCGCSSLARRNLPGIRVEGKRGETPRVVIQGPRQ